jgi:GT2 family glycosyltransferase
MGMPPAPLISIVIVTWNSGAHLEQCRSALASQTRQDFEIVIVDNGSSDESIDGLEDRWKEFNLVIKRLDENKGFTVGNNIGAQLARGKWIILLNADAYPEPDWLANLLHAAEQNPDYIAFSSRQLQYDSPNLLDGAGDAYHISGLAWRNHFNLHADKYGLEISEIFSPCAAAAMYSREEFLKVGGFDEDYFSYFEDIDLGFRLRLNGGKCLYVPNATVHHVGSASTGKRSDFSVYYGYRNLIWTFLKDMPLYLLWILLPLHAATMLFFAVYITLRGQGRAIWSAIFDAIRGTPKIFEKRRAIQKNRRANPNELIRVMSTGLFIPYREFIKRNRKP